MRSKSKHNSKENYQTQRNREREENYKNSQRDGMRREEGAGFRIGNTCIPVADSF